MQTAPQVDKMSKFKVWQVGDFLENSPAWKDNKVVHYDFGVFLVEAQDGATAVDIAVDDLCSKIHAVMKDGKPGDEVFDTLTLHGWTIDGDWLPTQGGWIAAHETWDLKYLTAKDHVVWIKVRLPGWV